MLGESVETLFVNAGGAEGDRQFALIDEASGRVASAWTTGGAGAVTGTG
ncbi:hypothetical protein [Mycolicibacterium houstonense]